MKKKDGSNLISSDVQEHFYFLKGFDLVFYFASNLV